MCISHGQPPQYRKDGQDTHSRHKGSRRLNAFFVFLRGCPCVSFMTAYDVTAYHLTDCIPAIQVLVFLGLFPNLKRLQSSAKVFLGRKDGSSTNGELCPGYPVIASRLRPRVIPCFEPEVILRERKKPPLL